MPPLDQGIARAAGGEPGTYGSVTCPFCGLHCDDLEVRSDGTRLTVTANGCPLAKAGFEQETRVAAAPPSIEGRAVPLAEAIARAGELIAAARLPLFGGLATDVEGMRAVMALADRAGGVVDHMLSRALYRNTDVLQTSGWFMSTLTETRNRADLVVIVASDVSSLHPRFLERIVSPAETMLDAPAASRTVVLVGEGTPAAAITGRLIGEVIEIACANADVGIVLAELRALLRGAPLSGDTAAGVPVAALGNLAERCKAARYAVFVWAPQALDFPAAEDVVHIIADVVRDLNRTTRAAGLSLGGSLGVASAASVCSWQSGYPLRVSFAGGVPTYDPYRFEIARMLAEGEGDLLVWVSAIGPDPAPPPATRAATIVVGSPAIGLAEPPAVFIPVGTPGLDDRGRVVRCDSVVSLPLRRLRALGLPGVAEVASALAAALPVPVAPVAG